MIEHADSGPQPYGITAASPAAGFVTQKNSTRRPFPTPRRAGRGGILCSRSRGTWGVKSVSLSRWLQQTQDPGFRHVEILTSGHLALGSATGMTVTTPSGIRIEGLDLETLIALLRQLA